MTDIKLQYNLGDFKDKTPEQIKQILESAILDAIDQTADIIVEAAKQIVPVDTGTLQKSIRKEVAGNIISVIAGGTEYINPKTKGPCNYAPYVEAQQPFMKLALASAKEEMIQLIEQKVEEKLNV